MTTENYIVRVYRRTHGIARGLVGMVEIVETEEKKPFVNFEELKAILESRDSSSIKNQPERGNKAGGRKRK